MSEGNILSGGLDRLEELRTMLVRLENDKAKSSELSAKEEQLERQIKALEKELSDKTASITKTRCAELTAAYDEQLEKTKSRLRKVRMKKDKQKNSMVSDRIASETAEVREERKQLYEQIKQLYKENRIPRFLNNGFVHALYIPQSIKDILIIILTLAAVLFVLPCGIYYFAFRPRTGLLVAVYIATVLLFGGIYVAVNRITKEKHPQVFEKIKTLRRQLNGNRKNIRSKERAIRKDKDESLYGLEKFNDELKELETELESIAEEKKKALKKFETQTKAVIAGELAGEYAQKLDPLRTEHEKVYDEQRRTEESVKALSMKLTNEYNSYLGKENLDITMIDEMIRIMEAGEASTIKDALNVYRGRGAQIKEKEQV